MGRVVTDGNIEIGFGYFKKLRKKPRIVVKIGNDCFDLGSFKNEKSAEFFVDKLAEMVGAKDEKGGVE